MNIFVLDYDPTIAAQYHCDKHVVKMILESAQLLCTAHHVLDSQKHKYLYKKTHVNHPCAKWVRQSMYNYDWVYSLFVALCKEYTHRYGKKHLCETKLLDVLAVPPSNIPTCLLTDYVCCMDDQYKISKDPVENYQNYYKLSKAGILNYTNREKPDWITVV